MMNIFNSILEKLGIQKPASTPVQAQPAAPTPSASIGAPTPNTTTSQMAEAKVAPKPTSAEVKPAPPVKVTPTPSVEIKPAENKHNIDADSTSPSLAPDPSGTSHGTVPMVDVMSMLEELSQSYPGADWKVSINDLLLMLGFEHSYEYRKKLALELGCPKDQMADSARMNVWLHKTVLQKIADNGGNIPPSLLS